MDYTTLRMEEMIALLNEKDALLTKREEENFVLQSRLNRYEELLRLAQQHRFGVSSEKTPVGQLSMFDEFEVYDTPNETEPTVETVVITKTVKVKKGKHQSYDHLEKEQVYHYLAAEDKECPICENEMTHMRFEVRKELKYYPARIVVVEHHYEMVACRFCQKDGEETPIITASILNPPIKRSLASPSLLAAIIFRKFVEATPLHRQEQIFKQDGLIITRQNMANWVIQGSQWFYPLFEYMRKELVKLKYLHADETVIQVLREPVEKSTKLSYMWLYRSNQNDVPIVLFEYQPSREKLHPKQFLLGFTGYLSTDGYAGYNSVEGAVHVGCWSHCRRYYTNAIKALPKGIDPKKTNSWIGLEYCNKIFHFERLICEQSNDSEIIQQERVRLIKPILDEFFAWATDMATKSTPKSKFGEAITYTLNQWDRLNVFLIDGKIPLENNISERSIRKFVIGRNNFLFANTAKGARSSAIMYSIVETAKENGLRPMKYMEYLFQALPNINLSDELELAKVAPWSMSLPAECYISQAPQQETPLLG